MSDHISGPRALAEPAADITDLYAFPTPDRSGWLSLVLNTRPFTEVADAFSDGLIYRFRLRSLVAGEAGGLTPFAVSEEECVLDLVFEQPTPHRPGRIPAQVGVCQIRGGEMLRVPVGHVVEQNGLRAFAGARWDPFIMDAPAALKTIESGQLSFQEPSSIYLDGKNVLSIVVDIDCGRIIGSSSVFGVIGETLTRGNLAFRIERTGRPEVKNMLLAPKQFDRVNRDLEIRDLYNSEDAFRLADTYRGAYRARLNSTLAFWDSLDGKTDWPADEHGDHPLTQLILADFLTVDASQPFTEHGSFLEIELAALEGHAHRTGGGRSINDDVMDRLFTLWVNGGNGPPINDGVDQSSKPATTVFPYLAAPNSDPPPAARTPQGDGRHVNRGSAAAGVELQLDDIQYGAIRERPSPYVATYLLVRIDQRQAGRELLRRLRPLVGAAQSTGGGPTEAALTVALTYQGLKALGVPEASLNSFAPEFREGMASRAAVLGDVGESSPDRWERPLGTPDVHVAIAILSPDDQRLQVALEGARRTYRKMAGIEVIWRQDCYQLPNGRTSFGFKDGIGQPSIEGSDVSNSNPLEAPIKAGEFILGYPDETGVLPPMPVPDVFARNGTYIAFRKLHTRVAAYRQYLRTNALNRGEERRLGAKMVGRWQSGAPLVLCPDDAPDLGDDPQRNNRFLYKDDPGGFRCPAGAHARRANPRDALDSDGNVNVRLHRMIRRGTSYGPPLPEGVLEDDGADRGIIFVFAGTHLDRQFEFVKSQWLNDGIFIGAPEERDPLVGSAGGSGRFTIPQRPIRRRLQDLPPLVVTRGGEYCFVPGLRALEWLAALDT